MVGELQLNLAIKCNAERFAMDSMFQPSLAGNTKAVTRCNHIQKLKFSKPRLYAFAEHSAVQVANVLASPPAVEMGIYVVRVFARPKQASVLHADLAKRLSKLDEKAEGIAMARDTFSRNTRNQLKQVFDALRELMTPPDPPKRPIGFVTPEDKGSKKTSGAKGKA